MSNSPQDAPDPEQRKNEALIRKTKLESRLLAQQLTPSYKRLETLKTIVGASGLVIALVTLVGGFLSVGNWFVEQKKTRQIRTEERLDRALTMLADESAGKRLAAVTSLRSFLAETNDTENMQVVLALSGRLSLEDGSAPVRNAIISVLEDVDPKIVGPGVLNKALRSLVETSRGLMQEGDVWRTRPGNLWRLEEDTKVGSRLQGTAQAIVALLRKGARTDDLRGIYIGRSDLTGIDLSGTRFDDAILAWSDFSDASLAGDSFDGADLEQTKFVHSDLRGAKLTLSGDRGLLGVRWDYVERQMYRSPSGQVQVWMPDFSCSDLRNADFTGHPLFAINANDIPDLQFVYFPASFYGANVKGADLHEIQVFGTVSDDDHRSPIRTISGSGSRPGDAKYTRSVYKIDPDAPLTPGFEQFSSALRQVSYAFSGSNWRDASLPKSLREWLDQNSPESMPRGSGNQCESRTKW
jgi:uncharacterized protein YjbI with pentapeptide repeats